MEQTVPQRVRKAFPASYQHNKMLQEYLDRPSCATHLKLPYFFSKYNAYELREAAINGFNTYSDLMTFNQEECDEWEDLIVFLRDNERRHYECLYPKVLAGYVMRSSSLANLRAIRFALALLEGKHEVLMAGDNHIVKTICSRLNRGLHFDARTPDPQIKRLGIILQLDGLFGVLPEIKKLLEAMLNSIFHYSGIFRKEEALRIDYNPEDFIQVERALKIILRERHFDLSFLPLIEKMTFMHKEKCKAERAKVKADTELCDINHLMFPKNQATLDESLRLLRQSHHDHLINDATRRHEIIAKYGNPDQI